MLLVISSAASDVMHSLASGIIKYFHIESYHVKADSFTGITIKTANSKALGADRIVDAAAAYDQRLTLEGLRIIYEMNTEVSHEA